tara:strand:- start:1511 stop:1795 length:285 start_codon:yes stop_codon:yes gene_type:complete
MKWVGVGVMVVMAVVAAVAVTAEAEVCMATVTTEVVGVVGVVESVLSKLRSIQIQENLEAQSTLYHFALPLCWASHTSITHLSRVCSQTPAIHN